ncbi:unnamed protein product, partial [Mesorhabditis spiculigera]
MTEETQARKPLEFDGVQLVEYFQNLIDYEVEFEPENPNFRCLFQRAHVLNASKVLILIEIVVTFLYMIVTFPWWFLWIFFHLPILLASIYAIKKENPTVLLVKLGFMLLYIGLFVSLLILSFVISGFSSQSFLGIFGVGTIESTFFATALIGIYQNRHDHCPSHPLLALHRFLDVEELFCGKTLRRGRSVRHQRKDVVAEDVDPDAKAYRKPEDRHKRLHRGVAGDEHGCHQGIAVG